MCSILCDPMDNSLPASSVQGILQARILEWVSSPPPGDLPNPGIEPESLTSLALAGEFFTTTFTWEALISVYLRLYLALKHLVLIESRGEKF